MLKREDFYNIVHFEYGMPDYGSYKGMRYRIALEPLTKLFGMKAKDRPEDIKIRAYAWREPWNFDVAEDKVFEDFDYTEDGINQAVSWLNEQWVVISSEKL